MAETFNPHEVSWTPERIRRFWNFYSVNTALDDTYFARQVGQQLIAFVARRIKIGVALDYGCGRGDLIGYLLQRYDASGVDQSPESVEQVNARFRGNPRFKGAFVLPPPAAADTVFILEVVEHLNDEALTALLEDARRILSPGGHVVVTTPNMEDLSRLRTMCPECGCIFHTVQHVRSWTAESLQARLANAGFEGHAVAMVLSSRRGLGRIAHRVVQWLRGIQPNLVYIGKLKSDMP